MPISRDRLRGLVRGHRETPKPTAVCEGLMVTGEVPRLTDFEDTGFGNIFFP